MMRLLVPLVLATSAAVVALQGSPVMLVHPVASINAPFNVRLLQGDRASKAAAHSANHVKKDNGVHVKHVTIATSPGKKHPPAKAQQQQPVKAQKQHPVKAQKQRPAKANEAAPQSPKSPLRRSPSTPRGHYETKGLAVGGKVGLAVGGAVGGAAGGLAGGALGTAVAGSVGATLGTAAGTAFGTTTGAAGGERAGAWIGGKIGQGMDKAVARHNAKVREPKRQTSGKALMSNSFSSSGGSSYFMGIPPLFTG
ncbi:hypothetical protein LEN26_003191 [Aphanomyces euteiches]|nr:hypothetical protein LEN26_003191 [Aphanomyces euteiches]